MINKYFGNDGFDIIKNSGINSSNSKNYNKSTLHKWIDDSSVMYSTPEFAGNSQNQHRGMKSLFNKYALFSNYNENLSSNSPYMYNKNDDEKTINKYTSPTLETLLADWDKTMAKQKI